VFDSVATCVCVCTDFVPVLMAPQKVTFGGSYKVDDATTVYAAADEAAKVSFAYKQKLNSFATVSLSAQVDSLNLASDNHKFGVTVNLTN
jgi:Eukaryotic porin